VQPGNIIFVSKQFEISQTSQKFNVASQQRPAIASNGIGRYATGRVSRQRPQTIVYKKLCYSYNDLKIYTHIPGTMQNRTCSQSMLKPFSFHIQAHAKSFLQILEYFSQSVDVDSMNLFVYSVFELFDRAGCIFVHFALQ